MNQRDQTEVKSFLVADGTDLTVVILVIAMIGKLFASAAFDILYLVTAELFPTILR